MVSFCNASLDIKQSADGTQVVPGLIDVPIYDIDGAWEILRAGARNRSVAATNANELINVPIHLVKRLA